MPFTAYNNVPLPSFMYGTAWKKDATARLTRQAVEAGFRAIDTANQQIHYQEALVGAALHALTKEGTTRESLFLQTKFTPVGGQGGHTPYDAGAAPTIQVRQSFDSSLEHLHTDYIDSYVLHGPYQRRGLSDADWEVWAAMERIYQAGTAKMIGISNVSAEQLAKLCEGAKHKPMVVQNRCYAALGWDRDVRKICREHKIVYQGFSLLTANVEVLGHPDVRAMARRLGTGTPQVIFAFALAIGMLPLTGTSSLEHMKDDLGSEQLSLTADEVQRIEAISG